MTSTDSRKRTDAKKRKLIQQAIDYKLDEIVPRGHRFAFLRVPEDLCAKCGKTRKEHAT